MKAHLKDWKLASSGVSVDAGPVRIRMEAAGTLEQRKEIARLIEAAPDLRHAAILAAATLGVLRAVAGEKALKAIFGEDSADVALTEKRLEAAIAKTEGREVT